MAGKKSSDVAVVEDTSKEVIQLSHSDRQSAVAAVSSLSQLRELFGSTRPWEEIEPSFLVVDKEHFADKPLVIGGFRFNESKQYMTPIEGETDKFRPAEFVSMLVAAYDVQSEEFVPSGAVDPITGEIPVWVIVNDGGAGIFKQLMRYSEQYDSVPNLGARKCPPITASHGFRSSTYDYQDPTTNKVSRATTWYIG